MVLRATNLDALAGRGASLNNTDFVVLRCSTCGVFALYDEECMGIYLWAEDLRQCSLYGFSGADEVMCPCCGREDSFAETADSDLADLQKSAWSFAMK